MKQVVTVAADQLGRDVAHQPFSFTTQLFGCAGEQFDELSASDVDASFHLLPCRLHPLFNIGAGCSTCWSRERR